MNNMNQSSSTESSYYAPPPAMVKGLYLPTEKLAKQLKQKKLLPQMPTPPQPLDADTFHPVHLKRKSRKPKPTQEKKKEHSSVWGVALLIGGGALVALIATLTFNKEAREKVAEVVPFLKTKTEGLGEKPKIDPQQPHIDPDKSKKKPKPSNQEEPPHSNSGDPNINQLPNNSQHSNVAPEPVLTDPPQDNAGGNGTENANEIGEGGSNNGRQPFTDDSFSAWEDLTDQRGMTGNDGSSGNLLSSDDPLSEFVDSALAKDRRVNREASSHGSSFNTAWREQEEGEYRRPLDIREGLPADTVVADAGGELLAPDVLPIQLTTLSSPKLIMPAQEIKHSIDREAGDEAWRYLNSDLDPDVSRTDQMGWILPEATEYMYRFKRDEKKLWSTEELFRFQAKLLNAVNNPDRLRPGLKEELMNNQNRQAYFNWQIQHMSEMIIKRLERDQYRDQGTARGLNSEENHLALFYAYYNHFHLLAAMKTYTAPLFQFFDGAVKIGSIQEAPRPAKIQEFMRDTLTDAKEQLGKLKDTPYDFNADDSDFFKKFLTGYLYPADADSAAKWGAGLPDSSGINFLLQPPHFPSEQAYLSLEKARDSIRVFKELGFEAKQDCYNYLEHAETYYGKQIQDDVHQHRYYGYAGLAETYALKAQVFKLENRDQTTINSMIEEAKKMLEIAKNKSSAAGKNSTNKFDYGYVMDSSESWRIKSLIDDARP